jgi:ATP-dependent DNA ligase I
MTTPDLPQTLFAELAQTSARVSTTRSRLAKKKLVVEFLATVPPAEIAAAVGWLVAEPQCGPLGVGPAHLWELLHTSAAAGPSIMLAEVEHVLAHAANAPRNEAMAQLDSLFQRLTEPERALVVGALTGTLRQGSLAGLMLLALVDLSGRSESEVRRAVLVTGSIARAAVALGPGEMGTPPHALELFRPLAPMLANSAESLDAALAGSTDSQIEWKIDGIRSQVHKLGDRIAVYSRHGNDMTSGCAPLLGALKALGAGAAVLDGEVVLTGPRGEPRPFQDSFSAVSGGAIRAGDRLAIYLFDCMHLDGKDLLDAPLSERRDALCAIAPLPLLTPQMKAASIEEARAFYADALSKGHEGVMVKDLGSSYRFGSRGRAWQKVKEHRTADLVVLAAEWGSGRRTGLLSNLHLGARGNGGQFVMVGKTFKGLTDAVLHWQTLRLTELATERTKWIVRVRPELVVEIRYNDVQRSPRYPGGVALRFARVVRYRPDKTAADAEAVDALVARLPRAPGTSEAQLSLFDPASLRRPG